MNQSQQIILNKALINKIKNGEINKIKIMGSSMLPTIASKEYVNIKPFNNLIKELKINDIVVAVNDNFAEPFVVHRVKEINYKNETVILRGDNQDCNQTQTYNFKNVYAKVILEKENLEEKCQFIFDLPYKIATSFNTKTYEIYQALIKKNKNCFYIDLNLEFNELIYKKEKIEEFNNLNYNEENVNEFLKYLHTRRQVYKKFYNLYHFTITNLTLYDYKLDDEIINLLQNYKNTIYYKFFKDKIIEYVEKYNKNNLASEFIISVDSFDKLITSTIFSLILQEIYKIKPVLVDNSTIFFGKYNTQFWESYYSKIISMSQICKTNVESSTDYANLDFNRYIVCPHIAHIRFMQECYYKRCKFCDRHSKDNFCYKVENIYKKILSLKNNNINKIIFKDDCLAVKNVVNLLNMLEQDNIKISWKGTFRFEKSLNNEQIIEKFSKNGCKMLFFGLESFDQNYLDYLNKGIKIDDAVSILKLCKKYNIKTSVSFIFNFPGETIENLKKTYSLLKKHINLIDYCEFNTYIPTANNKIEKFIGIHYYNASNSIELDKKNIIDKIKNLASNKVENSFYIKNVKIWE